MWYAARVREIAGVIAFIELIALVPSVRDNDLHRTADRLADPRPIPAHMYRLANRPSCECYVNQSARMQSTYMNRIATTVRERGDARGAVGALCGLNYGNAAWRRTWLARLERL